MLFLENCVNCVFRSLYRLLCEHWMLLCRCISGWLNSPDVYLKAADYRRYSLADKQDRKSSALLLTCACLPLQSIWISQSTAAASLRGMHSSPPSPFNIMTLSSLIAFWEAHVVLTLASWLHFPWCIMMVLSFFLSCLGRRFASERQLYWSTV